MDTTLTFLSRLGKPEQLWEKAKKGVSFQPQKANTHIHLPPNFSAFTTVQQAVKLASEKGLRVLGAGNYYDFGVYEEFGQLCEKTRIFPLFSTELIAFEPEMAAQKVRVNDPGNPGKIYLCGKGISKFAPMSADAASAMAEVRRRDGARMKAMIDKLAGMFAAAGVDTKLDEQAVIARVVKRHGCSAATVTLQERHIAQAFQEVFFELVPAERRGTILSGLYGGAPKAAANDTVGTQNDFRSFLMKAGKSCFVPESFGRWSDVHTLICKLGGIPCYPTLADGAAAVCEYETPVEELIARLKERGYAMAEFIPIRNKPDVLTAYATAMRKAGIVITAGTEHNTLDLIPLLPACVGGAPVPAELVELFWEGVCVTAAHIYLNTNGQTGFVDDNGKPNAAWSDAEKRIADFAKLGQVVLDAYWAAN